MAQLQEVMAYICTKYPHKSELSKARLTKMVYLADWRMALDDGRQITNLVWTFNHYGPYLEDVKIEALEHPARFEIRREFNLYGAPKELILDRIEGDKFELSANEIRAIDHVIEATKSKNWSDFIKFVYSTYPIATQPRYVPLDLVELANRYRDVRSAIQS